EGAGAVRPGRPPDGGGRSRAPDPGAAVAGAPPDPGDQGPAGLLARLVEGGAQRPSRPLSQAPLAGRSAGCPAHHPRKAEGNVRGALGLFLALLAAGPASANAFVARTAGAATVIAIDETSVLKT